VGGDPKSLITAGYRAPRSINPCGLRAPPLGGVGVTERSAFSLVPLHAGWIGLTRVRARGIGSKWA
jgi:hypothetical protein